MHFECRNVNEVSREQTVKFSQDQHDTLRDSRGTCVALRFARKQRPDSVSESQVIAKARALNTGLFIAGARHARVSRCGSQA